MIHHSVVTLDESVVDVYFFPGVRVANRGMTQIADASGAPEDGVFGAGTAGAIWRSSPSDRAVGGVLDCLTRTAV